ncbi:hypothetical protein ACO0RG_002305 [Hanseniaspora osmophila]|uniref:Putative methyltransferase n=1 Tax=Hanseniaspora osmophila TaxID=56408 RepID=A0A1E5RHM0_9ASCO|nr:putative methyltransferase [Hanseniaspora osmophila]
MAPSTKKSPPNGKNLKNKKQKNNTKKSKTTQQSKPKISNNKKANVPVKVKKDNLINRKEKNIKVSTKDVNYSICIPTSILNNCSNLEQITYTLYQIAKSCTLYNINEVVILKDTVESQTSAKSSKLKENRLSKDMIIATILQFFVTPPYLVKSVFNKKYWNYFKYCEKLPRLTSLPFMRHVNDSDPANDQARYREGLSIRMEHPNKNQSSGSSKKKEAYQQTKYINVGKSEVLELKNQLIPTNVRVTCDLVEKKVVSPEEAYGNYFGMKSSYGYHIRVVDRFSQVFMNAVTNYSQTLWINSGDFYFNKESNTYNNKVVTKIPVLAKIIKATDSEEQSKMEDSAEEVPQILLMFGKWKHLATHFKANSAKDFDDSVQLHDFFDAELQLPKAVPMGNIRTEDAVMIAMTMLDTLY